MLYPSLFKSPEAEAQYLASYRALLDLWSVEHEALDINTRFGTTHINVAGSPDSPPLLLLHGSAVNSTIWYPNIAPLAQHFRIYAPDIINQMGLSVSERPPKTTDECAEWLIEIMDKLDMKRASIVGHSYGGWLTLKLALTTPNRIDRMILISPAPAIKSISKQLILRMLLAVLIPFRGMFYRLFRWLTTSPQAEWQKIADQLYAGAKTFRPQAMKIAVMSVFSDEELRQVSTPGLLLIGDKEVVYKPEEVIERAKRLIPDIESFIIPNASHLAPVDCADEVNQRMIEFLTH